MVDTNKAVGDMGWIYISKFADASQQNLIANWNNKIKIPYVKYSIKESDMRIKTATFESPQYFDLTTGLHAIKIVSKYHENFGGIILDVEYDEKNGLYSYQCQDFSRLYIDKFEAIVNKVKVYNLIQSIITRGVCSYKPTKAQLKATAKLRSGMKSIGMYNQALYKGNIYGVNAFNQNVSAIFRDKTRIEAIRDIVFSILGFYDVWFNDNGILQIEPISKYDWENTGLHLTNNEFGDRKFKFSTTNAITSVIVTGKDTAQGKSFKSSELINLDLKAFFGNITTSISNQYEQTTNKSTTNAVTNNNNSTTKNKTGNPYGKKAKKIWIGADGGSGGFTKEIVKLLQKNGWSCKYSGEGASVHNNDYENVTSDYQILAIVDNGFCCTTVKEAYEGYASPLLKKKNVIPMFMFDSRNWNGGMKPYKYGNFKGYVAKTAWDDPSSYCTTMNVDNFFRKHKAVYCANPTAKGMVDQFLAGGYYASKGIKV